MAEAASDTLAASPHPAASALTSRPTGGLGRGLARILDPPTPTRTGSRAGLQQLLGRSVSVTPPRVRQFVTDTALGVIADGFEAEAVAIARVDETGQPVLSTRLPPSWDESSGLIFSLYGTLWGLLDGAGCTSPAASTVTTTSQLGGRATWLGRQTMASGELAAAVVRGRPFTAAEEATLARLFRSVAVALGPTGSSLPPDAAVTASARCDGTRWRAETVIEARGKRRRAFADAGDRELAVARAAAKLCRQPVEVSFAGRTEMEGTAVTLVVVNDEQQNPYLGLAVTEPDDQGGAVEAVFSAVGAMAPA